MTSSTFQQCMEPKDITYLVVNLSFALGSLVVLYYLLIKKVIKMKKYKRLMTATVFLSLSHSIGALWMYYLFHLNADYHFPTTITIFVWSNYVFTICGNLTTLLFAITQIELLRVFSVIAPYWTPSRVSSLQWTTVIFHLIATMPCFFYPAFFWAHAFYFNLLFTVTVVHVVDYNRIYRVFWLFVPLYCSGNSVSALQNL
jgi:uncharacterized membrane protein YqjE